MLTVQGITNWNTMDSESSFNEYKSETDLNNFNFNFGDTLKFTSFAYLGEQDNHQLSNR